MRHFFAFLLLILLTAIKADAQMNIGSPTAPDSSAMLQISGTGKGFLPPRMSRSEMNAIMKPAKGLVVFNTTDSALFMRRDTGWVKLFAEGTVTSASVVSANGLSGTVANSTTMPAITLSTTVTGVVKGNGTSLSAATPGTDYAPGTAANATGIVKSTTGTGALTTATASDFPTLNQNTTGTAANITGILNTTSLPAITGDVTSTAGSANTTIANNAVTNAKMANMAANTFKANNTGSAAPPSDITATQATAMLDVFGTTKGLVPGVTGNTTQFLRADGTFAVPPGTGLASLNGLTGATQTFATGTSGTDFNIASSGTAHTFNLPDASVTARGAVTTGVQTIAGSKTFSSAPAFSALIAGSVPFIGTGGLVSQNNPAFFWDAVNSRLGIGTNTPSQKLDVNGTIVASGTVYPNYGYNSANRIAFGESNVPANETGSVVQYGSGSNTRNMIFAFTKTNVNTSFLGNDGSNMILGTEGSAPIVFRTGLNYTAASILSSGSEAMRITSANRVGIGTTSPSTALHVSATTNPLTLNGVAVGTNTSADSLLTITNGLVRKLPLSSFATTTNSWSTTGNGGTTAGTNFIGTTDAVDFAAKTNGTERIRISSSGNVGIGATTFNATSAEKLLVDAGISSSDNYQSIIVGKANTNNYAQINIQNTNAGTTASSDIVATADNGDESSGFIDMGINSSGFTGTGATGGTGTAYLYSTGNDLAIGNGTANKSVVFFTGGLTPSTYTERFRLDANGRVGIGTKTPASDLAIFQSSGIGSTKGVTFAGNSIGGTSSGSGFLMSLGYNTTSNKQIWLGDPDYANNSTGTFLRIAIAGTNLATLDAVAGDNSKRRYIALGTGGDANAGVVFGNDLSGVTNPSSFVWDNGNMSVGSGYKSAAAPTNGLVVQGTVGIGTSSPNTGYASHIYSTGALNTLIDGNNTNGTWLDINNSGGGKWGIVSSGTGNGSGKLYLYNYTNSLIPLTFLPAGNAGFGVTSPTAIVQLKAGTATAGTAPLKLTSGTSLTTPEDGAVEYDGTNYYATQGSTRYTLAKTLTASASLTFLLTTPGAANTQTITVTGVAVGDAVSVGIPSNAVSVNGLFTGYVSAANTVTIKFYNYSNISIASFMGTFKVTVIK